MVKYKFDDIAINSILKKKPTEEDKYTYIGLEHLDPGSLKVVRYGSEVAPKGEKLLMKKGDVLFGKRRAYQKKVGIAPFDGIFSAHGMVLRPKENVIDKDFFPLFISSDYFLDAAIKISVGSLSPTINWKDLKELEFELPSMEKQRELAQILWAAEETKQSYKSLLQKTDDLVKARFEEMFGGSGDKCFFDKKQWIDVVNITNGKDHKKVSGYGPYAVYGTGGRMFDSSEYMCEENTIIMGRKGTIDKPYICLEKSWIVDTAFGVNPKDAQLNHIYLYYCIKQIDFSKLNKASTLPSTTKSDLLQQWIAIPPIKLQNDFADFYMQAEKQNRNYKNLWNS